MSRFIIKLIITGLFLSGICYAQDLELSDVIREARETAGLKKVNTQTFSDKTSCGNVQKLRQDSTDSRTGQNSMPEITGGQSAGKEQAPAQN